MEAKLLRLLDYQKFAGNSRLAGILADAESRYAGALNDDELEMVSAAGTTSIPTVEVEILLARHDTSDNEEKRTW